MVESGYRLLIVMRHAKTEPSASSDRARRLTSRGQADARAAGRWLADTDRVPGLVLHSPAARAVETAELVCSALGDARRPEVRQMDDLYGASAPEVVEIVTETATEVESLLVIGHNPTMGELAHDLQREPDESWAPHLPTAGVVVLKVGGQWTDLTMGSAELVDEHVPRG
jgi:phosphohistidine phosphatase